MYGPAGGPQVQHHWPSTHPPTRPSPHPPGGGPSGGCREPNSADDQSGTSSRPCPGASRDGPAGGTVISAEGGRLEQEPAGHQGGSPVGEALNPRQLRPHRETNTTPAPQGGAMVWQRRPLSLAGVSVHTSSSSSRGSAPSAVFCSPFPQHHVHFLLPSSHGAVHGLRSWFRPSLSEPLRRAPLRGSPRVNAPGVPHPGKLSPGESQARRPGAPREVTGVSLTVQHSVRG